MQTIQHQVYVNGAWLNLPAQMLPIMQRTDETIRELVDRADVAPLIEAVKRAQAILTEDMQPMGPSKSETIKALQGVLLTLPEVAL